MMARKHRLESILDPENGQQPSEKRSNYALKGASGQMKASLDTLADNAKKLMEGETIVEIDPEVIDASFVKDRLSGDDEEFNLFKETIREKGQETPVLLRPHPKHLDRYMIVFGHRRVRAARELQRPVRAVVKKLDDVAHILAQGQENSARANLSFIEKAFFAKRLMDLGHEKDVVLSALTVDATLLSRLLSVSQKIDVKIIEAIGPARSIGRDRWEALKKLAVLPANRAKALELTSSKEFRELDSDGRFDFLLKVLQANRVKTNRSAATPKKQRKLGEIGSITLADNAIKISLNKAHGVQFRKFLEAEIEELVTKYTRSIKSD